jgi:nucleotide-binding universal stress UspA family protein
LHSTAAGEQDARMHIDVRRILVPIDFSAHAEPVIRWAIHLAEEHGSTLVLLHAYHLPVEFQQLEGAYLPQEFWASVKAEAEANLEQFAARVREAKVPVEVLAREGYPATVIEDEAVAQRADMIVIGTRGRSGLKHLLLGSIAERVVQKAPCPVLTVRLPEAKH